MRAQRYIRGIGTFIVTMGDSGAAVLEGCSGSVCMPQAEYLTVQRAEQAARRRIAGGNVLRWCGR